MIISNPPYICSNDIDNLQPEIRHYEPRTALDGGKDGLKCLRHIIERAHRYLKPKGRLVLEIGHDQREAVHTIVRQSGCYTEVIFTRDYGGYDRVVEMVAAK